jgi:hypothetical protein
MEFFNRKVRGVVSVINDVLQTYLNKKQAEISRLEGRED